MTLQLPVLLLLACALDEPEATAGALPGATAAAKSTLGVADLVEGDLVITEIMQNPAAVSDSSGEWFEVLNASGATVDLDGLEVSDSSGKAFTVSGPLELAAGERAVFGRRGDPFANGGVSVDYSFGSAMSLGNGSDDLILSAGGVTFDQVAWDNGSTFPDPNGVSMSLDPDTGDASTNDDGASWCESTSSYGLGDLGTPGAANDSCAEEPAEEDGPLAALDEGDLVITELLHDPRKVSDYRGEWFEVFNDSGQELDLDGLEVSDSSGQGFTVSGVLTVADGARVVLGRSDDVLSNGGATVDYAYGADMSLGNGTDDLSIGYGDTVFDSVSWDDGATMPDPSGASINLSPDHRDALDNDNPSAWCASTSAFGDGDLGTPGSANDACGTTAEATLADLGAGDLVITEIMQNPSKVTDALGEWFEVRNTTETSVDLQGLFVYDGGWDFFVVTSSLVVDAGDVAVFGRSTTAASNGGVDVDHAWSSGMNLGNSSDMIVLAWGATVFDSVSWDDGASFPDPRGASMVLDPAREDATDNDDGASWCESTSTYGDGDLGTPGADNDGCPGLSGPNTAPVATSVSLTPSDAGTDDTLTATVATFDADGHDVTVSYAWVVNGSPIGETGETLDGALWFDKGDEVAVTVTPNDGQDDGTSLTSAVVTIANTAPVAPVAAISPSSPSEADDLLCEVSTEAADADGDILGYAATWTVDGVASSAATTTTLSGDTVPASATSGSEVWACTLTASDGEDSVHGDPVGVTVSTEICPVYTDPTVLPGGDGSAADPYPSIAYAMAYRGSCTELVLGPGTYDEALDFGGVDLTVRSSGGAEVTILEPSVGGDVVTFTNGETADAVLEGVTVRGGDTGVWIDAASPTIQDCIIEDNTHSGVQAYEYDGLFAGNLVQDNSSSSSWAGGLYLFDSDATLSGNTLVRNTADTGTGAIYAYLGAPAILGNHIEGNGTDTDSEVVELYGAAALVANNLIVDNHGKAIELNDGDASVLVNNTVVGADWVVRTTGRPTSTVVNNVFADATYTVVSSYWSTDGDLGALSWSHNLVYDPDGDHYHADDRTGEDGNIAQDPQFTDDAGGDYSLAWGSLAIDRGTDASGLGIDTDHDGGERGQGVGWDMGAFEHDGPTDDCDGTDDGDHCATACPVYIDTAGTVDGDGSSSAPYPNVDYALAYRGSCTELLFEAGTHQVVMDFGGEDLVVGSTWGPSLTVLQNALASGHVVSFQGGETTAAVLEGVFISSAPEHGIFIDGASPTIRDTWLKYGEDTAVHATGFDGVFEDNRVQSNNTDSSRAPGIYLEDSDATLTGNLFSGNTNGAQAGDLEVTGGAPVITGNDFSSGSSNSSSEAVELDTDGALFANNVIVADQGSALLLLDGDASDVVNNTIVGGTNGIRLSGSPSSVVVNNIVAEPIGYAVRQESGTLSGVTWTHNDVYDSDGDHYDGDDPTGTDGNISQDPQFTDAAGEDFSLVWGSLCIDAGTSVSGYSLAEDFEGDTREQGLGVDMGAIESY